MNTLLILYLFIAAIDKEENFQIWFSKKCGSNNSWFHFIWCHRYLYYCHVL